VNVLLVAANTERINIPTLPLGLAQVAAATEAAGHRTSFLNLLLEADADAAVARAIAEHAPDVIGISVRNIDDQSLENPRFLLEPVRGVVRTCRAHASVPIVVGGAGYSIFPRAALDYLGADFGVCGEGEGAFPALLAGLENGEDPVALPGVHAAAQRAARPWNLDPDLDRYPLPDPSRWLRSAPADFWVPVQSRRGCALDCSYCSTASIEGGNVRFRSPHRVARDLERTGTAGFRRFYFVDNTFNLPEAYALDLCRAISGLRLDLEWRCIVYPLALSAELAHAMRQAGCVEASIGFESGSEPILRSMNKRFGPDDIRVTCDRLATEGIRRNGFLLVGGPGETPDTVATSVRFAESLRLDMLKVTLGIRIYPGTPLHRQAVDERIVRPDDDLLRPRFYLAPGLDPDVIAASFCC
jgi:radical SAM superfamily enzyme YgiQ (UPF0313 family)